MSNLNEEKNRVVWVDIPVRDLDRAAAFYGAVLKLKIHKESFNNYTFCILDHQDGNGGCLVPSEKEIHSEGGILIYMNVNGRIIDAAAQVTANGGKILQPIHAIGPHGFRTLILDSEGNRLALHSATNQ